MPVQNYNINTRDAVAGALFGMSATRADIQTRFNTGATEIFAGQAVDTDGVGRGVTLGTAVAKVYGISIRQVNREMNVIPGQGVIGYAQGEDLGVVSDGRIVVEVLDAITTNHNAFLFVGTDGVFSVADRGTDIQTTNVKLDQVQDVANSLWSVVIMNSASV